MTPKKNIALVDKAYRLEKFPGKGGWTYARIPEILQDKHSPFGWVRVKGSIDDVEFSSYHLMPMGNGQLFLPVKADIRKKIGKKEGDWIHVKLYADNDPVHIPDEFQICLDDEPAAARFFKTLTEGEKKYFVAWIYSAKRLETRVTRMAEAISKLSRGMKFHDKMS
jgi:hypothetical protein